MAAKKQLHSGRLKITLLYAILLTPLIALLLALLRRQDYLQIAVITWYIFMNIKAASSTSVIAFRSHYLYQGVCPLLFPAMDYSLWEHEES